MRAVRVKGGFARRSGPLSLTVASTEVSISET
ncbi:UNVERIFIED_ORG: hypothetical protein GGD51_000138 [Rhizobium esperanzae]